MSNASSEPTTFVVGMPRPQTHLFAIEMRIAPFREPVSSFDLVLPVWAPGSYFVRDYARHVQGLSVTDGDGREVLLTKVGKNRWRVGPFASPGAGPFVARYEVYANELTVRTSQLDSSHGYGNGPSLLFYVDGRKDEAQAIRFEMPAGWHVSIALPEEDGVFRANDYDELVDSPFECGTHPVFPFEVRGVPHTLAIWGDGNQDPERLVRDLAALVEAAACMFGGLPYQRYLFLVHLAPGARGRHSTKSQ
jgi:predicted metalloprotease with PDZ domain